MFIPVEVKTGRTPAAPHDAHIFQLAVYCLLVEKTYGKRPSHGIIHYPSRDFEVDFTLRARDCPCSACWSEIRRDEQPLQSESLAR